MFCLTTVRVPALTAAALFAATAAVDIPHDQPRVFGSPIDYVLELLFALALAAASFACNAWVCREERRSSRLAVRAAAAGFGLLSLSAWATAARGEDTLGVAFLLGLLLVLGASVALLVLDLRRAVTPRFAGLTFALGTVAMLALGEGYGVLAWTASWAAIAALASPADQPAELARATV
jgi:hypothetical protein